MLSADDLADVVATAVRVAQQPLLERIVVLEAKLDAQAIFTKSVETAVGAPGPPGERGTDGAPGRDGPAGRDGRDGTPGPPGDRGIDGKDGRDGLDGKDGLGFDDLRAEHDGERGVTVLAQRGDQVKTIGTFTVPALIHRGVWLAEKSYVYQDAATWAGSSWVCMAPTATGKPGEPGSGWVLVVKHGRDGKDGKDGKDGLRGKDGIDGKDGRYHG